MYRRWVRWTAARSATLTDAGLLVLRLLTGLWLVYGHGWKKVANFGPMSEKFGDPLGLGSFLSLALVTFAEFVCAALIVFGLVTRFAAAVLVISFSVAVFVAHADDPFAKKELALLYLTIYAALTLTGPGRWSIDEALRRRLGS